MGWVGPRAAPKAAGLQRMLWPGHPRRGPSVGHGYKNVNGQGTVTTPWRTDNWSGERLPRFYQHRNGNHGPRVLLGKPGHTGWANDQSKHDRGGEEFEPWSEHLSTGGWRDLYLRGERKRPGDHEGDFDRGDAE